MPEPAPVMAATRPLKSFIAGSFAVTAVTGSRTCTCAGRPENSMKESSMSLIFSAR